jgi:hypothetical protein
VLIVLYLVVGALVLSGTVAIYFGYGGKLPTDLSEWAAFGTYIGGTAGPLLSFLALIAIAHTIAVQQAALEHERDRQLADQHLRWLDELYKDIKEALDARIDQDVMLRDVLDWDIARATVDQKRLALRLDELMKLLAQYCQAVDMYRDNISEFYDLRIYADRGGRVLDKVKPFMDYLGGMIAPTIEFCDMHLRGDSERKKPEALTRSSRNS